MFLYLEQAIKEGRDYVASARKSKIPDLNQQLVDSYGEGYIDKLLGQKKRHSTRKKNTQKSASNKKSRSKSKSKDRKTLSKSKSRSKSTRKSKHSALKAKDSKRKE